MHRFLLTSLLLLLPVSAYGQALEVDILFSERHRPHVAVVKALSQAIRAEDVRLFSGLENGELDEENSQLKTIRSRNPDLIVLVGEDALLAALGMHIRIPMISIMSMSLNHNMQQQLDISGIDLRPSPVVVADELAHLLPKHAKVLSYYNPDFSANYIDEAAESFRKQQLNLLARPWPKHDTLAVLNSSIKTVDAYWMQMEYRSVEPDTLRLLFELAKHGKKLIGLSAKYVRAGALIAWTPRLRVIGQQAAKLVNRILDGEHASHIAIQHPEKMKVNIRTEGVVSGDSDE